MTVISHVARAARQTPIPTGWNVTWNTLTEPEGDADIPPVDDLSQDLLQLQSSVRGILIDVGWYPDWNPEGSYRLVCIRLCSNDDEWYEAWENPLRSFECRSFRKLRDQIEAWLIDDDLVVTRPWHRRDAAG